MAKERDFGEIIENNWLVEFDRRPTNKYKLYGFVLDCNDDFTLIEEFDIDWYKTDGYWIFQNESVKKFRVYDSEEYYLSEVIKLKKIKPTPQPKISIENWSSILQSVQDNFPLVQIETELIRKDACFIGTSEKLKKNSFELKEIDSSADWDETTTKYKFKDLTKVCFDSAYIKMLWEVSESRKSKSS